MHEEPHFEMSAGPRVKRPLTDIAEVDRTMDEIIARQGDPATADLVAHDINADAIWKNYRAGKATPTSVSTLPPSQTVDGAEVKRRLRR